MEAVMVRFYATYEKLSQALDCLPYDELEISDEVREQVIFSSSKLDLSSIDDISAQCYHLHYVLNRLIYLGGNKTLTYYLDHHRIKVS